MEFLSSKIYVMIANYLMIANFKFDTEIRYVEGNQYATKTPNGDKSAFSKLQQPNVNFESN